MKGGSRLRLVVACGLAAALALSVVPALAEQAKFPSRLTIQIKREVSGDTLKGKVRSDAHACEAKRKVRLFHRSVKEQEKASVLAKVRTNGKGKWSFRAKPNQNGDRYATPGEYHVEVGTKKVSTGDGEIVCNDRSSPALFVG